ncbi:MAG TPA: L-lactate permease, partial [Chitinophagaceae bacterium]|nr:L-lactate permease [Chitinophagaceae bacterium]
MEKPWLQNYDPLNNAFLSTLLSSLPVIILLGSIALFRIKIHFAALFGLLAAIIVAAFIYRMPAGAVSATTVYGAAYGLFPIGW